MEAVGTILCGVRSSVQDLLRSCGRFTGLYIILHFSYSITNLGVYTASAPSYLENHQPTPSNLVSIWTTETNFFLRKHPQVSPPSKSTYFLQDYEIFNMSFDCARTLEIEVKDTISPKVVCCKDAKHLHMLYWLRDESTTQTWND